NAQSPHSTGLLVETPTRQIPWEPLKRLRPVHPFALRKFLTGYSRLEKALTLHKKLFPEYLIEEQLSERRHIHTHVPYVNISTDQAVGWWDVLGSLVNLVSQHSWFEIDWDVLNNAWAIWQGGTRESDPGAHLAVFLDYIPIQMYGFNCKEALDEFPPMELFHVLFSLKCDIPLITITLLTELELYDTEFDEFWSDADRQQAWLLLEEIESDPGRWPEPVRWLPEMIRWACHETKNPILDRQFDPYRDGPWFPWDDVDEVRYAWQRAQGVIKAFQRLMTWYEEDCSRLGLLAEFLMEGKHCDDLTW
ncbi:MAG: hypothetical protein AAF485_31080, partial [Chloroflexota bacterium]